MAARTVKLGDASAHTCDLRSGHESTCTRPTRRRPSAAIRRRARAAAAACPRASDPDRRRRGPSRSTYRTRRPRREDPDDRVEFAARGVDREALPRRRALLLRSRPGGHHRPGPGRREVRSPPRPEVLDVRNVLDPTRGHARTRRGDHHPHPGPRSSAHRGGRQAARDRVARQDAGGRRRDARRPDRRRRPGRHCGAGRRERRGTPPARDRRGASRPPSRGRPPPLRARGRPPRDPPGDRGELRDQRGAQQSDRARGAAAPPPDDFEMDRSGLAARRVSIGAAGGLAAAALALVDGASWSVAALCASDFGALVFVIWVWATVSGADAAATSRIARAEDASRAAAEAVLIAAGAASLVAVVFTLGQAGHAGPPDRGLLTALALASVALAWMSVHTVFALRYARLYYSPPEGGIDFQGEAPDYHDFAYLALTIGMTFQVSDTDLTAKRVRHVALHHALLSYVFGTGIVAITVSSVGALLAG